MARHDTEMRKAAKRGDKEAMVEHRNQVLRLSGHLKMLLRTTPQGATRYRNRPTRKRTFRGWPAPER